MTYTRLYGTPTARSRTLDTTSAPIAPSGYTPSRVIGQGVVGTVFEVTREGRSFALKQQSCDEAIPATVLTECMVAAQCEHPCINPVVDIAFGHEEMGGGLSGDETDTAIPHAPTHSHLVMRLASDGHLGAYMGLRAPILSQRAATGPVSPFSTAAPPRQATLSFNERRQLAFDILAALSFLHEHSVIHGDLSPHNVVVHRGRARLIDFGLAVRDVGQPKGGDAQSLCFRAPEVFLAGAWGPAVDMWSYGCLLRWVLFADAEDYLFDTTPYTGDGAAFFRQLLRHRRHSATWPATAAERQHYLQLTMGENYAGRPYDSDFPAVWRPRYHLTRDQELAVRALTRECLRVDARERPTAAAALCSPLFHGLPSVKGTWHGVAAPLRTLPAAPELQQLRQDAQALQLGDATLLLACDLYSRWHDRALSPTEATSYRFASLYIAAALTAHAYPVIGEQWGTAAALHALTATYQREYLPAAALEGTDPAVPPPLSAYVAHLARLLDYQLYPDNLFTTHGETATTRAVLHAVIDGRLGRMAMRFWQQRRYRELLGMATE